MVSPEGAVGFVVSQFCRKSGSVPDYLGMFWAELRPAVARGCLRREWGGFPLLWQASGRVRTACAPWPGSPREVPPAGCGDRGGAGVGVARGAVTPTAITAARVRSPVTAGVRVRVPAPALSRPLLRPVGVGAEVMPSVSGRV